MRAKESKTVAAARFVLNRVINGAEYASAEELKAEWMPMPEQAEILRFLKDNAGKATAGGDMFNADGIDGGEAGEVLNAEREFSSAAAERKYYADCVARLTEAYDAEQVAQLKEKYKELTDRGEKLAVLREIQRLMKKPQAKN